MSCANRWKCLCQRWYRRWSVSGGSHQGARQHRNAAEPVDCPVAASGNGTDLALQQINEQLSAFNYMVSHELRAGLRVLDGTIAMLRSELCVHSSASVQYGLRQLQTSVHHMQSTVTDLLHMAMLDQRDVTRQEVDVTAMVWQICHELRALNPHHVVQVSVEPAMVAWGEATLLRDVLRNLLANAWKFTADCAAPRINVGVSGQRGERCFYVCDNGIGFDESEAGNLFKPFRRLHNAQRHEGTGIGLYTVKRIVERHGGTVWAHAISNGGACFQFTLGDNAWHTSEQEPCRRCS